MLKQAESLPNSPDELLRYCDLELQRLRTRSKGAQKHRAAVLAVSLLVLVFSTMAAFLFLFSKVQDLPRGGNRPSAEVTSAGERQP